VTKASDNIFPKILGSLNTSDPAAPVDSSWKLYAKADGWYSRSSNAIAGPFGAGGGGSGSITASGYTQNTARLLGRTTASAGAVEEITVGSGLSLSAGSLSATGGGGAAVGQVFAFPSSFTGDSEDMTATTNWADVGAQVWGTRAILNSTILDLAATGASQACVARKTLGTTRAADFDYRTYVMPGFTYWSAEGDTTFEWVLTQSGGTAIAAFRLEPRNTVNAQEQMYRLGVNVPGSYTTLRGDSVPVGMGVTLRIVRVSGAITFWYGLGPTPIALRPIIDTSANAPYSRSDPNTVARVEYRITTPAGPGSTAYHHAFVDYFQDAS
jgi:hypothetical protein